MQITRNASVNIKNALLARLRSKFILPPFVAAPSTFAIRYGTCACENYLQNGSDDYLADYREFQIRPDGFHIQ